MRKIDISQVKPGSKLARNIYNPGGQILLRQKTILTQKFLDRLKTMGFYAVFIEDGLMDDIDLEETISEKTRLQATNCIREVVDNFKYSRTIQIGHVKKVVTGIVDDIIENSDLMLNLTDIRSYDDYTFHHSVNVTVISVMIGLCLHYDYNRLCDLGLGVLLHDIGKTMIPVETINKPGRLTHEEYQIVKQHTWHGFEILRSEQDMKITSAHVALQHHERYDGSGYPRQLKGQDILEYARIAAIADVYDAMTSERCYRSKIPVNEVRQYLLDNSGTLFDPVILNRFLEKISLYPQGTKVVLNDGRSGLVIKNNCMDTTRPLLRLFWNNGSPLTKPVEINLYNDISLHIVEVVQ